MSNQETNFRRWSNEYFGGEYEIETLEEEQISAYIERVISEKPQIIEFLTKKISEEIDETERDEYTDIIKEYYDDDEVLREMIEIEIHELKEKLKS